MTPPPTIRHKRVIGVYKPPQSHDKIFIERLPNQLNDLYTRYDNALLLSDFKMTPETLKLQDFCDTHDLEDLRVKQMLLRLPSCKNSACVSKDKSLEILRRNKLKSSFKPATLCKKDPDTCIFL